MKSRSTSLPVLLVAVIVLSLCSVGTATAAGALTKGQVKKIAAKVLTKAAPGLSVAHAKTADSATTAQTATTAGSATTAQTAQSATAAQTAQSATTAQTATNAQSLGGQPASAYTTPTYRYLLPVQSPSTFHSYTFSPMPAGNYLVSISTFFSVGSTTTAVSCAVRAAADVSLTAVGYTVAVPAINQATCDSSGIVTLTNESPALFVSSYGGGSFAVANSSSFPSYVTFTRVDTVTDGTTTASP